MSEKNKRVCPVERAGHLDNFIRKLLHNPRKILVDYVKEGMCVLDIGCGPGLFSIEIAKMVGNLGKVIAVDLQEGMLNKLRNKIKGTKLEKMIKLYKCEEDKLGVSEKVDLVLAFYVVHEVPDQERLFKEIKSILKPNGKMMVIEPGFHVSKKEFEKTVKKAVAIGFKPAKGPKVFWSRSVVFKKS